MERLLPRYDSFSPSSSSTDAANSGISTGQNAISSFDPTTTAGAQKTNLGSGGLGGLLGGETGNYIGDYSKAVANNPTVTSLYNTANNMFNVPGLAKTANYWQNLATNAVPDAYTGARGFDIDSTDINNGIASKMAFASPQENAATNNLNTAEGLASNFVQSGQTQNAQNLLPVQAQGGLVTQQEGLQGSGWNQASQQELEGLMQKMNAGVTLSQAEITRATQLAQMEEQYQQAQATNQAGITEANIKNKYQVLSPAQTLANTFTGGVYHAPS